MYKYIFMIDKIRKIKLERLSPAEKYIISFLDDSYSVYHKQSDQIFFKSMTKKDRYDQDVEYFSFCNCWMYLYIGKNILSGLKYKYNLEWDDIHPIVKNIVTLYTGLKIKEVYGSSNY